MKSNQPWPEAAYFLAAFLQTAVDVEPAAAAYRTVFAADAARLARLDGEIRSLVAPARSEKELDAFLAASAPRWRGYNGRQVLQRSARVLFDPSPPAAAGAMSAGVPGAAAEGVSQPSRQTSKAVPAAGQAEQTQHEAGQVVAAGGAAVTAEQGLDPRVAPHPRRLAAVSVDISVVAGLFAILALVGQLAEPVLTGTVLVTVGIALVASFACFHGLSVWLTGGQTIGKALYGLTERRIEGTAGAPPGETLGGLAWAIGRHSVGYLLIDVFGVGTLAMFVSRRRRCVHDLAFGSEVVSYEPGRSTGQDSPEARLRSFWASLKLGLERSQQRLGWAFALVAFAAKVITVVTAVVYAVLKVLGLTAPAVHPITTTRAADTPAAASLSGKAVAALTATTTVATVGITVALVPSPDYTNINIVRSIGTFEQPSSYEIYIMRADLSEVRQLTFNESDDIFPDLFRDRRIVFSSDRDGDFEIYVMNADGTDQVRLTDQPGTDWDPAWSPDGDRIVFTSDRDGDDEIYVMDADGTDQVRLTHQPGDDFGPAWSPDGDRIVFTSGRDGDFEIYVMNVDGTDQVRLTDQPGDDFGPEWSPDGKKVLFFSRRDAPDGEGGEFYLMDPDGTDQTRLTRQLDQIPR